MTTTYAKTCEQCGRPYETGMKRSVYCSRACTADAKCVPLARRFWLRVPETPGGKCWEWRGTLRPTGYGYLAIKDRERGRPSAIAAHRLAYLVLKGVDPGDLCVCHICDNRQCVNPDHLFLGTTQDNTADRQQKGRQARGDRIATARLSPEAVAAIKASEEPGRALGALHGVSKTTIYNIRKGKIWRYA